MNRDCEFEIPEWMVIASTNMLCMGLYLLLTQPAGNFCIGNHESTGPADQFGCISDMIAVTMADQYKIGLYIIETR